MPFSYDLPGIRNPKSNQFGLRFRINNGAWTAPINYSSKVPHLRKKMKEHRQSVFADHRDYFVEYQIIDINGTVLYAHTFKPGESDE